MRVYTVYVYIYTYTVCVYIYIYVCVCICMCIYLYIYMYIYICYLMLFIQFECEYMYFSMLKKEKHHNNILTLHSSCKALVETFWHAPGVQNKVPNLRSGCPALNFPYWKAITPNKHALYQAHQISMSVICWLPWQAGWCGSCEYGAKHAASTGNNRTFSNGTQYPANILIYMSTKVCGSAGWDSWDSLTHTQMTHMQKKRDRETKQIIRHGYEQLHLTVLWRPDPHVPGSSRV